MSFRNYIIALLTILTLHIFISPTLSSTALSSSDDIKIIKEHIDYPIGVSVDSQRKIYVADRGSHKIHIYNANGKWEKDIGDGKINGKRLFKPYGIYVDESLGRNSIRIFVIDSGNHRVVTFDSKGKVLKVISKKGKGKGKLKNPSGIYMNTRNEIIVADSGNDRVQIFDLANGSCIEDLGERYGDFDHPRSVTSDISDNLFICNSDRHKIVVFDKNFKYKYEFGQFGNDPGQFNHPQGIAIDPDTTNIFVSDHQNHRIQVLNNKGDHILSYGINGSELGQFRNPNGIAIDSSGRIIVADSGNHRVQIISDLKGSSESSGLIILAFVIGGFIGGLLRKNKGNWYERGVGGIFVGAFFYLIVEVLIFKFLLRKFGIEMGHIGVFTEYRPVWAFFISGFGSYFGITEAIDLFLSLLGKICKTGA